MKDLSNPLEYGAPFQAILRDYYSKFQIENYKIKPYFIIGNVEKIARTRTADPSNWYEIAVSSSADQLVRVCPSDKQLKFSV